MLICNNCKKQYKEGLRFCPTCGHELVEVEDKPVVEEIVSSNDAVVVAPPVTDTVVKVEEMKGVFSSTDNNAAESKSPEVKPANGKFCISCGAVIAEGENFCLKCGMPVNAPQKQNKNNETVPESGLQSELLKAFKSNMFFEFLLKFAVPFALYYPIYLLIGRIDALDGLSQVLEYISTAGFYGYYIGLAALYARKNYLPMLIAFAIRFINSSVLLFQSEVPISSIGRIAVLVFAFIFIFKKFSKTGQYQTIMSNFRYETKTCPKCGSAIGANDTFCPKCGNKIGG